MDATLSGSALCHFAFTKELCQYGKHVFLKVKILSEFLMVKETKYQSRSLIKAKRCNVNFGEARKTFLQLNFCLPQRAAAGFFHQGARLHQSCRTKPAGFSIYQSRWVNQVFSSSFLSLQTGVLRMEAFL